MALPFNNITVAIIGRLLNGLGAARAVNRRFIVDAFNREERTSASASFVTAGALGMSAGPAIASLLSFLPISRTSTRISHESAPGWIMFVLWILYFPFAFFYFEEPTRLIPKLSTVEKLKINVNDESQPIFSSSKPHRVKTEPLIKNIPVITTLGIYFVLKLVLECQLSSTATITSDYFGKSPTYTGIFLAILGLSMFP